MGIMMVGKVPVVIPSPSRSSTPSGPDMSTATPGTIQPTKTPVVPPKPNHGIDQYGFMWVLIIIVVILGGMVALVADLDRRKA